VDLVQPTEIDYYAVLHRQVFGREIPQVMLLHANRLNAAVLEDVLTMFEKKGYQFVSLAEAQTDQAFATPETYVSKWGPMWGYRWASVRGVKVDGGKDDRREGSGRGMRSPGWWRMMRLGGIQTE
jgi:hypothetical protein